MKVIIITLPKRTDRQEKMREMMEKWGIEFEFYFAQPAASPQLSNANAHREILKAHKDNNWLMIMEDDCYFTENPLLIPRPAGYWQYYFGANITNQTFNGPAGWSILQGAWGTYCIIYSKQGINYVAQFYNETFWGNPCYDDYLRGHLHLKGKSLIYNKFIALTYPGFSDVDNRECDYTKIITDSQKFLTK